MNQCVWCGETTGRSLTISEVFSFSALSAATRCGSCTAELFPISEGKSCFGCGRVQETTDLCPDCLKWQRLYPDTDFHHKALYEYDGLMKEWLEAYKFKGDYRLASFFKEDIKEAIRSLGRSYLIVPIPVSESSLEKRGFNQVEGLFQAAGIPFLPALEHRGNGKKQSEKNRAERMTSEQPFLLRPAYKEKVKNKKILIVDDVYTTGRTLFHARDTVKEAGVSTVCTFSLAR